MSVLVHVCGGFQILTVVRVVPVGVEDEGSGSRFCLCLRWSGGSGGGFGAAGEAPHVPQSIPVVVLRRM